MQSDNNIWQWAESYLEGSLGADEQAELKNRLAGDAAFALEFNDCLDLLRSLKHNGERTRVKNILNEVHHAMQVEYNHTAKAKTISLVRNHWRTAAIAACIAILTSLTTFWMAQHNNSKIASQYSLLRRDLETYKRNQNQVISDIQYKTDKHTPAVEARYTGTGFALTNNGYLVTSYHVISGADSVYIQDKQGVYYKANTVAFNETTDIVILKVEDKKFRFGKQEVPYSVAAAKRKLGARVYTLGFPQDEIVYNEGYISAKNGYEGDSSQYRLDISAEAGQSGSPVVDASGNIIGIITGKESLSAGTTYAVATSSLLELLESLPKDSRVKLPATNKLGKLSREQQIEKLEQYTCAIKVYKK